MNVNAEQAGYYAGYIAAVSMVGRMLSSIQWGQLADKLGRKPIILIGLFSIIICSVGFGMSTDIWTALTWRFLLGLLNPLSAISKTLVSEVCAKQHESIGMGTITGSWGVGLVVGPAIGGMLSRPAESMPHTLGRIQLLRTFPYLLPNIITAILSLITFIVIALFFEETLLLPSNRQHQETLTPTTTGAIEESYNNVDVGKLESLDEEETKFADETNGATFLKSSGNQYDSISATISHYDMCQQHGVYVAILSYALTSLISIMIDTVFPLWVMSNASSGGFEYSPVEIGHIMSFTGVAMILYNFLLYPIQANIWGERKSFYLGTVISAPLYLTLPLVTMLHCGASSRRPCGNLIFFLITVNVICIKLCGNLAFSASSLLINRSVPQHQRASLNGVSMTLSSVAKAIGPCIISLAYAWSVESDYTTGNQKHKFPFDFHLVFILLALCALLTAFCFDVLYTEVERESSTPALVSSLSSSNSHSHPNPSSSSSTGVANERTPLIC